MIINERIFCKIISVNPAEEQTEVRWTAKEKEMQL